jgi:hypothetical protein
LARRPSSQDPKRPPLPAAWQSLAAKCSNPRFWQQLMPIARPVPLAHVSFEAGAAPFISRLLLLASSVSIKESMIDLCWGAATERFDILRLIARTTNATSRFQWNTSKSCSIYVTFTHARSTISFVAKSRPTVVGMFRKLIYQHLDILES